LSLESHFSKCELCPRCCGINRTEGFIGYCRGGVEAEVFRYGPHHGEEPPISGTQGSGAIFFSRCTLKCVYCQNYPWSQQGRGIKYDDDGLAQILKELAKSGCHNWNLVSGTPWLAHVEKALKSVRKDGFSLPVVYNTSGFERVEVLNQLQGLVDIYLTDLRYSRKESANDGSGSAEYVYAAREALNEMWRLAGQLKMDENGIAVSGVICRLLILPGRAIEVIENLEWLGANIGNSIAVSVMAQYLPAYKAVSQVPWNRKITKEEYDEVCEAVDRLGFNSGWIQDFEEPTPGGLIGYEMKEGSGFGSS